VETITREYGRADNLGQAHLGKGDRFASRLLALRGARALEPTRERIQEEGGVTDRFYYYFTATCTGGQEYESTGSGTV